jgi:glycerophosphoryl diester phosphodiesterase
MVQPPPPVFEDAPVLCGHRGSGRGIVGGQPENTLGSFRAAASAGASWVEVDVRATADGTLVASHDPDTSDGCPIATLSAAEADELGLMRIADLLEDLPPQVGVNLEIKTALEDAQRPRDRTTAALTADLPAMRARGRKILATSFDPSAPLIVRERAPQIPAGLLTWIRFPLRKSIPAARHLGLDVVAPHVQSFRLAQLPDHEVARHVDAAHAAGLQVVAWCPVDDEVDRLVAAGVDCLIVDDLPAALARWRAT